MTFLFSTIEKNRLQSEFIEYSCVSLYTDITVTCHGPPVWREKNGIGREAGESRGAELFLFSSHYNHYKGSPNEGLGLACGEDLSHP